MTPWSPCAPIAAAAPPRVKTKATVNGSGAKPWRQKGTGRARAGYKSSPVWVGGGVVFGPHPRDYSKKVSKSVKKIALRKALSERIKSGDVFIVDSFAVKEPKTKQFVAAHRQDHRRAEDADRLRRLRREHLPAPPAMSSRRCSSPPPR